MGFPTPSSSIEFVRNTFPCATTSKLCLGSKRVTRCQLPTISISAHFDFRHGPPSVSQVRLHEEPHVNFKSIEKLPHSLSGRGKLGLGGRTRTVSLRAPDAAVYQLTLHPDEFGADGEIRTPSHKGHSVLNTAGLPIPCTPAF